MCILTNLFTQFQGLMIMYAQATWCSLTIVQLNCALLNLAFLQNEMRFACLHGRYIFEKSFYFYFLKIPCWVNKKIRLLIFIGKKFFYKSNIQFYHKVVQKECTCLIGMKIKRSPTESAQNSL